MVERICKNTIKKVADGNVIRCFLNISYLVIFESDGKEFVRCVSSDAPLSDDSIMDYIREKYEITECNLIQIIVI